MKNLLVVISFLISLNAMSNSDTVIVECINVLITGTSFDSKLRTKVHVKASSATLDGCSLSILTTSALSPDILHLKRIVKDPENPCVYNVQGSALRETYLCSNIR